MPRTQPPSPMAAIRFSICASSFQPVSALAVEPVGLPDMRLHRFGGGLRRRQPVPEPRQHRSLMTGRRIVLLLEHEPVMTWLEQP